MAAVNHLFSRTNIGNGQTLDVFYTYDDVTLAVSEFNWVNPGPPTGVTVTVNGVPFHDVVPTGTGRHTVSFTLLPPVKAGTGPRFPFTVSVAPD